MWDHTESILGVLGWYLKTSHLQIDRIGWERCLGVRGQRRWREIIGVRLGPIV